MKCKTPTFSNGTLVQFRLGGKVGIVKKCESPEFGISKKEVYTIKTDSYYEHIVDDIETFELILIKMLLDH